MGWVGVLWRRSNGRQAARCVNKSDFICTHRHTRTHFIFDSDIIAENRSLEGAGKVMLVEEWAAGGRALVQLRTLFCRAHIIDYNNTGAQWLGVAMEEHWRALAFHTFISVTLRRDALVSGCV